MLIQIRPPWFVPESQVTPHSAYVDRRRFVAGLGLTAAASALGIGCATAGETGPKSGPVPESFAVTLPPFERSPRFPGGLPPATELTPREVAASHNNFYEITLDKDQVWRRAGTLKPTPWAVEVAGLVEEPRVFGLEDLLATMPIEERVYRFRCVEAWSMVVPWVGFPLSALLDAVKPTSKARFVSFQTLNDAAQLPGIDSQPWYPWPYHEALRLDEARNDLAMLAVGIYGEPLPNQHGAPIRLVVPWKYGFKSIKSVVRIELHETQPATFWNTVASDEYSFLGNVRPDQPHPRWSQRSERMIPTGERVPTRMFNGYQDLVGGLYG